MKFSASETDYDRLWFSAVVWALQSTYGQPSTCHESEPKFTTLTLFLNTTFNYILDYGFV